MTQERDDDRYSDYPRDPSDWPLERIAHDQSLTPKEAAVEQVEVYIDHVFGEEHHIVCVATASHGRAKPGSQGKAPLTGFDQRFFMFPGERSKLIEYALNEAERGRHVFICVHGLIEPSRKKTLAAPVSCLWADVDSGGLPKTGPRPTMIVESSPGRYHLYFRLNRPIDPQEAEKFNKRLASALGADASGYDLTQLLRLPGTKNFYYLDDEGHPPKVGMYGIAHHEVYPPEYLDEALPPPPTVVKSSSSGCGKVKRPKMKQETRVFDGPDPSVVRRLSGQTFLIFNGGSPAKTENGDIDRSRSLFRIASALCEELTRQLPEAAIRRMLPDVLAERDSTLGWNKYSDRPGHYETLVERCLERLKASTK